MRGICVNYPGRCSMFERPVEAVEGDRCSECGQLLCHESGLTWGDAREQKPPNPNGFIVRFVDGPFSGKQTILKAGLPDPADEIIAFELEMLAPGVIGFFDLGEREPLDRDQLYRVRNRSQLPEDFDASHVIRGAEYGWVATCVPEFRKQEA